MIEVFVLGAIGKLKWTVGDFYADSMESMIGVY
jgi:hypothetical protein